MTRHPQPFNRVSFMTLNSNWLFTAEQVCDIVASHTPARSEQEIHEKVIQKFVDLIIEEMVYDDGDMYYKVNPEKYVNLLSELRSSKQGEQR